MQDQLPGPVTHATLRKVVHGFTLCCCHLEILSNFQLEVLHFLFALGSRKYVVGPCSELLSPHDNVGAGVAMSKEGQGRRPVEAAGAKQSQKVERV